MVQEFHVVRCFKCQSFQVQQVKKVSRWSCKLCGEKQSLLKEFGRGSGADCRSLVQKLNAMRGAVMEKQEHYTSSLREQVEEAEKDKDSQVSHNQMSRWSKYLDPPQEADPEDNVLMDRLELHCHNISDRKRKRSCAPEQSECSSVNPVRLPDTAKTTSQNPSSPPNQSWPHPPSKKCNNLPRLRTGPVSRWARFISSDCLVQEGKGPSVGGLTDQACHNIGSSRPLLPVSSIFESGDDFSFDDKFLTEPRL